jgi:transcriptional regulator GlxA family with amidase domain
MTSSASNPADPRSTSQEARQDHGVGGAVQQIVTTLLPDGYPDIHSVAELVRLSPRTLQRRLCDEGLTFAGVVAQVRFAIAQRMLADAARKVIDVAVELGVLRSRPLHARLRALDRPRAARVPAASLDRAPRSRLPAGVIMNGRGHDS